MPTELASVETVMRQMFTVWKTKCYFMGYARQHLSQSKAVWCSGNHLNVDFFLSFKLSEG